MIAALILAAGSGKRIGGPKALLAWPNERGDDRPLAIAHAEKRLEHGARRALVVVRKPVMLALLAWVKPGIDLVVSDADDALGPAGSIAVAVPKLKDASVIVVSPVDTPPASQEVVSALERPLRNDPKLLAARPSYGGRAGHPVVLRPAVLDRYVDPQPPPLRDLLRGLGDAVADVEVDDASVILDLNTPADVMGQLGSLPRFLG